VDRVAHPYPGRGIAAPPGTPLSSSVTIRVLTVDDHPVVRTGIRAILANEADMSVVAEHGSHSDV
jgi:hypothetical protein